MEELEGFEKYVMATFKKLTIDELCDLKSCWNYAWQASRQQAIEECAEVVEDVKCYATSKYYEDGFASARGNITAKIRELKEKL